MIKGSYDQLGVSNSGARIFLMGRPAPDVEIGMGLLMGIAFT